MNFFFRLCFKSQLKLTFLHCRSINTKSCVICYMSLTIADMGSLGSRYSINVEAPVLYQHAVAKDPYSLWEHSGLSGERQHPLSVTLADCRASVTLQRKRVSDLCKKTTAFSQSTNILLLSMLADDKLFYFVVVVAFWRKLLAYDMYFTDLYENITNKNIVCSLIYVCKLFFTQEKHH